MAFTLEELAQRAAQSKSNTYIARGPSRNPGASSRAAAIDRARAPRISSQSVQAPRLGGIPAGAPGSAGMAVLERGGLGMGTGGDGGIDWSSPKSILGTVAGTGLEALNQVGATYRAVASEVGDVVESIPGNTPLEHIVNGLMGNPAQLRNPDQIDEETGEVIRDRSFNFSNITNSLGNANDPRYGTQQVMPWIEEMPGGWQKAALGTIADAGTDPTTLFGGGVVARGANVGGRLGAKVLLEQGRVPLAQRFSKIAGNATDDLSRDVANALSRRAGARGAAVGTPRSAKVIADATGASVDDVTRMAREGLGVSGPGRYGVGVGRRKLTLPGTERVANRVLDAKGAIKARTGKSALGRATDIFKTADFGERAMRRAILEGSASASDKAAQLTRLNDAKMQSRLVVEEASNQLQAIPGAQGMSRRDRRAMTQALDTGVFENDTQRGIAEWFQGVRTRMMDEFGIQLGEIENYVPRRLSEKAKVQYAGGNPAVRKYVDMDIEGQERFQQLRDLPDQTIEETNAAFKAQGNDFDLLETDFNVLADAYLSEMDGAVRRAALRQEDGRLVKPKSKGVDEEAVAKEIKATEKVQNKAQTAAVGERKKAATQVRAGASEARNKASADVVKSRTALDKASKAVTDAEDAVARAEGKLTAANDLLAVTERRLKTARTAEKGQATKRFNNAKKKAAAAETEMTAAAGRLARARSKKPLRQAEFDEAQALYNRADGAMKSAHAAKREADLDAVDPNVKELSDEAGKRAETARATREEFTESSSEVIEANDQLTWMTTDDAARQQKAAHISNEADQYLETLDKAKLKNAEWENKRAQSEYIRDQMIGYQSVFELGDPRLSKIAALEASAHTNDLAALKAGDRLATLSDTTKLMNDPEFQRLVALQTDAGFSDLMNAHGHASTLQIADDYKQAIETTRQLFDPKNAGRGWAAAARTMQGYNKAMGWWKSMAVGTPGFVVRNGLTGMWNMYLDGVNINAVREYQAFHSQFLKNTRKLDGQQALGQTKAWAVKKYGQQKAERLEQALNVAAGSGWGQTFNLSNPSALRAGNLPRQGVNKAGLQGPAQAINPLSPNNSAMSFFRTSSDHLEATMRGGHAYHGLSIGDDVDAALARVERFHFNYNDLSAADEAIKKVSPFFMFFSRNMALTTQMFAKRPAKINRSWLNTKRNFEWSSEDDDGSPEWLSGMFGGIKLPFGGVGGGGMYFTPDIPTISGLEQMSDPTGTFLNQLGPGVGTAAMALSGKDFFTGRDLGTSLHGYSDGEMVARTAPLPFQLPGIKQAISQFVPGAEIHNDQLLMSAGTEKILGSINPSIGRVDKLADPETAGASNAFKQAALSQAGIPFTWNSPNYQAGTEYGQEKAIQDAEKAEAYRQLLDELTGG